jgi:hypothetical protein
MNNNWFMWVALVVLVGGALWFWQSGGSQVVPQVIGNDKIKVENFVENQQIASPLTVVGEARGPWYFEASFPVELKDGNGITIATAIADAQSDWMTTAWVPFSVTLTFSTPSTATGSLILHKDNPSGESINDDELILPVTF